MKDVATMSGDSDNGTATYPIRAVDRVCDILDTLANSKDGVSLSDLAEATGMPKSSTFRYLTALEARHYVERCDDGASYRLGLAFRPQDTRGLEKLAELAKPALDRLRDQLGETANLGVLDGGSVVHTVVSESPHMMRLAARVGERGAVHSTALGKAMCAGLPEEQVRAILQMAGMPAATETTITDPDRYLEELARTRELGYGVDEGENQASGRCVAVAIEGLSFPAGVSISAPTDRLPVDRIPEVARSLKKVARALSSQMRS